MEPGAIVKRLDVVEDGGAGFGAGGEAAAVDGLVFQTAPKRFDEGVIVAVAPPAHRGDEAVRGKSLPIQGAGKLGAAVGVHDEIRLGPALCDRHPEGFDSERGVQAFMHGPANDAPRINIQQRHDIQPALAGQHRSGIGHPNLVGPGGRDRGQSVWRNRIGMAAGNS